MIYIFVFFGGVIFTIILYFVILFINYVKVVKKGLYKNCFCNDCKRVYSLEDYVYCPYCGNKLDYHIDDL